MDWPGLTFRVGITRANPNSQPDAVIDAHELIALCAPRPVFISSGSLQVEGGWIEGKGMFLGAVGAGPVYKLLPQPVHKCEAYSGHSLLSCNVIWNGELSVG